MLNEELEETNRGVMALYNQLSEELEETNRGVVALYAELDEKSAQLRAASEAKSRFLANVSHELRAPVTAIIGLARLLTDSASDPLTDEQGRQVDLIRSLGLRPAVLVNELLDLAKAESGRIEPDLADVDLRPLFGQLRGTLRALATARASSWSWRSPAPARAHGRGAARPGAAQPAAQRDQVHRAGEVRLRRRQARRRRWHSWSRHRRRHPGRAARADLRGVLPDPRPPARARHRPRPALRPAAGHSARRRH